MQTFRISNLEITIVLQSSDRIVYVLSPFDGLEAWIEDAAHKYGVTIAVITGMDWDDDLTPWPAKGVPRGCPDFKGDAAHFLKTLTEEVLPEAEKRLNISPDAERTLTGASLSGLFTLWQWIECDIFHNIISLSGSFWYEGFAEWLLTQPVGGKTGRAYFLLGDREAKTKVKAFQPVLTDTQRIVSYLHAHGVNTCFELVPGNHYQYAEQRLTRAFTWMFGVPRSTVRMTLGSSLSPEGSF